MNQMATSHVTRIQLQYERSVSPCDLVEFDTDNIIVISDKLSRPGENIPNPHFSARAFFNNGTQRITVEVAPRHQMLK